MYTHGPQVTPDTHLVQRAVDLARENVDAGGKPFACLLVHQGK